MKKGILYDYNLQFFADDPSGTDDSTDPAGTGEGSDNPSDGEGGIDPEAFAAIIAEKDKKLDELDKEMRALKKSNAELLLKISAEKKSEIPLEQTIIDFCDTRRPVNRQ